MDIKDLNNIDKMNAIEQWQEDEHMHPITCGHEECRLGMYADIDENSNEVILKCPQGHIQKNVPDTIYKRYIRKNYLD